jgi:hypothetical protein
LVLREALPGETGRFANHRTRLPECASEARRSPASAGLTRGVDGRAYAGRCSGAGRNISRVAQAR